MKEGIKYVSIFEQTELDSYHHHGHDVHKRYGHSKQSAPELQKMAGH